MASMVEHVSATSLTELLQAAGYRVNETEQNGIVQLLSASQGIGFAVRFGNPTATPGDYMDFTKTHSLKLFRSH